MGTNNQTDWSLHCMVEYSNNNKKHHLDHCNGHSPLTLQGRQQLDFPFFVIFLLVLGKEYYTKDSTCLDQKCSTWSSKQHGGYLFLLAHTNKLLF